jgi:DNA polymerase (family 10)
MKKHQIAQILDEIAFFLLLKGENPYRARAYAQAAMALLTCPEDVATLIDQGTLTEVKGIGPATASVITEIANTGTAALLHDVKGPYPASLKELSDVPGLRMPQIRRLHDRAGITSLADLQAACASNRLLTIPGFGPKAQERLQEALGQYQRGHGYHLYANALESAVPLCRALAALPGVQTASLAGAIRRRAEVVDRLHFVLSARARHQSHLATEIRRLPTLVDVDSHGYTVTGRSPLGLPVTIEVTPPEQYGLTMVLATGTADHLDGLLDCFREQGLPTWEAVRARLGPAARTEEAVYRAARLAYIPPELREGRIEIQWARAGTVPCLVAARDIQGCFHTHTLYTDGANTVEEMVMAARDRGYRYLGISDHSQSAHYVNGLKEDRIRAQWAEINAVQRRYPEIHILKGIEADILPDGTMDYADDLLAQFDFVIASVHSRFNLSAEDQTRRICRALANRYVTMLGHPTGRLLLSRSGYRIDMNQVLDAAAQHGKMIEVNGSRHRLDLDWRWAQGAKDRGIPLCVNPDAHAVQELANVELGVNVARKGGLTSTDVANTASFSEMKERLQGISARPSSRVSSTKVLD